MMIVNYFSFIDAHVQSRDVSVIESSMLRLIHTDRQGHRLSGVVLNIIDDSSCIRG